MIGKITQQELQAALPDLTTTQHLRGIESEVEIIRDAWGIPHIRASGAWDLFFGQGFATAQDRLWQMDFDRHQALGRWAEFAGASGVSRDRLLRAAGMGRTARLDYGQSSAAAQAMVDAYAAGVNAFIESSDSLPVEYTILGCEPEAWENWHCLAVYKMRNTLLGTFEPKLFRTRLVQLVGPEIVAALLKGTAPGSLLTVPPGAEYEGEALNGLEELAKAAQEANWLGEVGGGSNAWSVSGDFTQSGLPLVAGDSHRALDTPNVYYQTHLHCGHFKAIGHAVPGMPGVLHFCHNERVAWGMTYGAADTQDLFIERFRQGKGGREYQFQTEWRSAQVLNETIAIRGSRPVETEITITHHGPVVAGDPKAGFGVAISDPGLIEGSPWVDAVRNAMLSTSVEQLHQAFSQWNDRVNNYAVADVEGNFGYLHEGRIPIRPQSNGWRSVPGWTGEHEWQGYIPHDQLPRAINPASGYAVTCNQRVADHHYPYYVSLYSFPDFRARRVQHRIRQLPAGSATVEDMGTIHAERVSLPAGIFTKALVQSTAGNDRSAEAQALLLNWDLSMDRERVEPTIYARMRWEVPRRLINRWLKALLQDIRAGVAGAESHVLLLEAEITRSIRDDDVSLLSEGESWPQLLAEALSQALTELEAELGPDMHSWQWGRLHRRDHNIR